MMDIGSLVVDWRFFLFFFYCARARLEMERVNILVSGMNCLLCFFTFVLKFINLPIKFIIIIIIKVITY